MAMMLRMISLVPPTVQSCAACLFPDSDTTITGAYAHLHTGDRTTRRGVGDGGDTGRWQRSETRLMSSLSPE